MLNTYGLTMRGLHKAVASINSWPAHNAGGYTHVAYDMSTGEVLISEHVGDGSRTRYDDPEIINCGCHANYMSAQQLADIIHRNVALRKER